MNTILKIDSILYRVADLRSAERFYVEVLGLKKAWEDMDAKMIGFVMAQSDSEVVIHADSNIPAFSYSYLVENVETFCANVKAQGHRVVMEPIDVRSGKFAVVLDVDGNEIPVIDLTKFGGKPRYD